MRLSFVFLFLVILLTACGPTSNSAATVIIPVPTATRASGETSDESLVQPITAEESLYVFLTAFENNPDEMLPFLSQALRENLPEGGIPQLLGFNGTLEGLVFVSGTTATNPNLAVIEARLQVSGQEIERVFYLERQDENWLITAVERPVN
jgi:hypothetical protein